MDLTNLEYILEKLQDNAERLSTWEMDRLEEWTVKLRKKPAWKPTPRQAEIIEEMWNKIP